MGFRDKSLRFLAPLHIAIKGHMFSLGDIEKRTLNLAIQAFSTSFYLSKSELLKILDQVEQAKRIFEKTF